MRKGALSLKKILILLTIVSFVLAGCAPKEATEQTEEAIKPIETVNVKVELTKNHVFSNTLQIPGEVKPFEEVMITSKIGGDVISIKAEIGDKVEKGQQLAKFDDTIYSLSLRKAKLGVESAQLSLNDAKKLYDNNKALYDQQVVSKNTFETYEKAYKLAAIGLETARADYSSARENYNYTTVKSPINGIVSIKDASVGENLGAGTHMFTVVNMDQAYIEAGISEMNVNKLEENMTVEVTLNSVPGVSYEGVITHIGPVPGPTNTYPVKILVKDTSQGMRSGMFATAQVALGGNQESLAVPKHAVQHKDGVDYVFIADGGQAKKIDVVLGLSDDDYYEVKSGLKEGLQLIISGQDMVDAGEAIKIQN